MANDLQGRIETATQARAESAIATRVSTVEASFASTAPEKRSFFKDAAKGLAHVAKVAWQVPETRGFLTTLLVRFGLPGTLVAIGMAVGDKLAQ
ncbi:hypothetical protein MOP88_14415 [Sphingomonas sp. WKB10]|nr:hypothetical protein [Sphingomonas sp. WKB10]